MTKTEIWRLEGGNAHASQCAAMRTRRNTHASQYAYTTIHTRRNAHRPQRTSAATHTRRDAHAQSTRNLFATPCPRFLACISHARYLTRKASHMRTAFHTQSISHSISRTVPDTQNLRQKNVSHSILHNQSPKGIIRSAVPLPCFFDVVKSKKGSRAAAPTGDKVL